MRRRLSLGASITAGFCLLATAAPARAQSPSSVHFTISGSLTAPMDSTADRFGTGGGISLGVLIANLAGEQRTVPVSSSPIITTPGIDTGEVEFTSRHAVQYVTVNGLFKLNEAGRTRPYLIGGGGLYYRSFGVTTPGVGFVAMCDPYWLVCYPTPEPIDLVVGHRITWDPGVNIGVGIARTVGVSSQVFFEARWHIMGGPRVPDGAGGTRRVSGQYLPITLGFRF
jgi:hypothetical protein